jgi:hypothetical protein
MAVDKKQVMDVSKPGKVAAHATSRPVIVGHGAMIKDPMVKENGAEAASEVSTQDYSGASPSKVKVTVHRPTEDEQAIPAKDEPSKDVSLEEPKDNKDETEQSPPADDKPEPAADKAPESSDEAVVGAVADQAALGKDKEKSDEEIAKAVAIQKLIEDKTYFIPVGQVQRRRNNRMAAVMLVLLLLVVVGAYLVIDAGILRTSINLPFHVFKQKSASVNDAVAPSASAQAQTATSASKVATSPANATTATGATNQKHYQSTTSKIAFDYPASWTVTSWHDATWNAEVLFAQSTSEKVTAYYSSGAQNISAPFFVGIITTQNGKGFPGTSLYGMLQCSFDAFTVTSDPSAKHSLLFTDHLSSGKVRAAYLVNDGNKCTKTSDYTSDEAFSFKNSSYLHNIQVGYYDMLGGDTQAGKTITLAGNGGVIFKDKAAFAATTSYKEGMALLASLKEQ